LKKQAARIELKSTVKGLRAVARWSVDNQIWSPCPVQVVRAQCLTNLHLHFLSFLFSNQQPKPHIKGLGGEEAFQRLLATTSALAVSTLSTVEEDPIRGQANSHLVAFLPLIGKPIISQVVIPWLATHRIMTSKLSHLIVMTKAMDSARK
jgi:hypothetical protein